MSGTFYFMRNVKLTVEYDGTDFVGWQYQANGRSVQGVLERAFKELLQEDIHVSGAGRTDAGVHARGQVANAIMHSGMDLVTLKRGINALLPEDVVVHSVEEIDEKFHARYSARQRMYTYQITTIPIALGRKFSWFVGYDLNLTWMEQCAAMTKGVHDFQAFCKVDSRVEHYRCDVSRASWKKDGSTLQFEIAANRFLYGMVRALVGTMIEVGRGYRPVEDFERILASKDRRKAGMAAPAKGLSLDQVTY